MGTGVQLLQGENYMYSRVLGHVQLLIWLHFYRVVLPDFYLPLVHFPAWIATEVREKGVLKPTRWVFRFFLKV